MSTPRPRTSRSFLLNDADFSQIDVVFLCLPHAAAAPTAARALAAGARVIDLSADFRIKDAAVYSKWYGIEHPHPELIKEASLWPDGVLPAAAARNRPGRHARLLSHQRPGATAERGAV